MTTGWVGVSVRARAMAHRRLGAVTARRIAASPSLAAALTTVSGSTSALDVPLTDDLAAAQRAVAEATLWNVRVLAGWAPRRGVGMLSVLAGVLEAANIRDHLRRLGGGDAAPPYALGALATAWPRVSRARSVEEVRSVLATSPWGDPAGSTPDGIHLMLDTSLADRVIAAVPLAASWASGATALLVAREVVRGRRALPTAARRSAIRVVGEPALSAREVPELARLVPAQARWALEGVRAPDDLWQAEGGWWKRVEHDGFALMRRPGAGPHVMVGAVALLAVDAWRLRAALEMAARGGAPLEVFDEMA